MTDGELVRQTLDGRSTAYEELVRRWSARILAVCHARVSCRHIAEDLAQETLLRGFRRLETLENAEKFGPWLRGIAHRVCLDWLKSKQSSQVAYSSLGPLRTPDELPGNSADSVVTLAHVDELEQLMRQVESLPPDYREVVMLYYYDDVTYGDVAELLGVSAATVNSRLTKARALLRNALTVARRPTDGL